jgi:hypothetical protein
MRKAVILGALLLVVMPIAAFAELGIGAAAFGKSPALVGQADDTTNLNVSQFSFGGDARLKLGWFMGEALVLYASGSGVNSFNTYLDVGVTGDLAIVRLSLGAGPNFVYNAGSNSGAQVGLNAKVGADVMFGNISAGLSYIMAMNIGNGVQINTGSGLLGANVTFWF